MAGRTPLPDARGHRAVFVTRGSVDPHPTTGGAMRRTHILRAVASVCDTTVLVTSAVSRAEREAIDREFGVSTLAIESDLPPASWLTRWWRLIRLSPDVSDLGPRARRTVQELVRRSFVTSTKVLRIEEFDLLRRIGTGPTVVDMDDLVSQVFVQRRLLQRQEAWRVPSRGPYRHLPSWLGPLVVYIRRAPGLLLRDLRLGWQAARWRRAEKRTIEEADIVLFSNHLDYEASGSPQNGRIVPNGFPLPRSTTTLPRPTQASNGTTIAFWGSMSYGPNADGARWLITDVLPLLRQRIPGPRVMIIGRGSTGLFRDLPSDVVVTGFVQDLQHALAQVDCAVVPLRMGAGTRIKILEAWAYELPVVSTSVGAYGLALGPDDGVVVADGAEGLADGIARVLTDGQLRQDLRATGRLRVKEFSWGRTEATVEAIVRSLEETKSSGR